MPRFAANLTMLYPEVPFLERFARARQSGFHFCEYLFPYEYEPGLLANLLRENNLVQVLFNMPPGDWAAGERGIAAHPDRIVEFHASVQEATNYARALGVKQLNCLAGKRDPSIPYADQQRVLIENLYFASDALRDQGITLLIELLNPFDVPGYWVSSPDIAFDLEREVARPNVKVLYDVYHAQRTAGELAKTIEANVGRIGHIQIADNPGRHQPGTGEINYRFLFEFLDRVRFQGWIGLEYVPAGTTEQALAWVNEYGYAL